MRFGPFADFPGSLKTQVHTQNRYSRKNPLNIAFRKLQRIDASKLQPLKYIDRFYLNLYDIFTIY